MLRRDKDRRPTTSTTDAPGDRADHVKYLKKHGLGHSGVELSDVKRGGRGGHLGNGGLVRRDGRRGRGNGGRSRDHLGGGDILDLGDGRGRHFLYTGL